jgi:hypothetical protein
MTSITTSSLTLLIYYVMTATNMRYSYLRVAVIRIDVHPTGENQTIHHTPSTIRPRMTINHTNLTWSMHSNLSLSRQQI